jgi:ATP-binding cassette subfamily B protein
VGFIMHGLDAEDYDRKYDDKVLVSRIGAYFRPALVVMVIVAALIVLNSVASMLNPLLADRIANGDAGEVIWILFFGFLLAGVLAWASTL